MVSFYLEDSDDDDVDGSGNDNGDGNDDDGYDDGGDDYDGVSAGDLGGDDLCVLVSPALLVE